MDKNKKNTIIVVSVLIVLTIFLYIFFNSDSKNSLPLTVESYIEKNDVVDIHVEYPQFSHLSKEFNKKIYDAVFEEIANFKKLSQENNNARRKTGGITISDNALYLIIEWSPDQLNNDVVSIVIRTSFYTGGAHGTHTISTFSYDVKNKKEITLEKMFGSVSGYLDRISQFAGNDLKSRMGKDASMDMIRSGTTPEPVNFSRFTIGSENTVTFYFPEYQVAPYSSGEWKVIMPISYLISNKQ
jgi:hypothetical protein